MIFYQNVKEFINVSVNYIVKEIYMQQLLPQINYIVPDKRGVKSTIEYLDSYIAKNDCKDMNVDISFMNVIDACYVSTICSAKHYTRYPDGKICWKISSELVKELNKDLSLGNEEYVL